MPQIRNPGPPVAEADITSLEKRLDIQIPASFRTFLLQYNGGRPSPNVIDVIGYPDSPTDVQVIFGIGREVESSGIEWNLRTFAGRLGTSYLPVGCDSGGCVFAVSLRHADLGHVYFVDLEAVYGEGDTKPSGHLVAPDFAGFLDRLRE